MKKRTPNFASYLSLTWFWSRKKKTSFLKGFRPRVSICDSAIPLHAISCDVERSQREGEKKRLKENRERREYQVVSSIFLCDASRCSCSRPSEHERSIRNVVPLSVEVASAFWRCPILRSEKGVRATVIPGFLPLFVASIVIGLLNPFAASRPASNRHWRH